MRFVEKSCQIAVDWLLPPLEATRWRLLLPECLNAVLTVDALLLPLLPIVHGESDPSNPPLVTRLIPAPGVVPETTQLPPLSPGADSE